MDDVELEFLLPTDELRPFVGLFYTFRTARPAFEDVERAQTAQLRFRLSPGPACYHFHDGRREDAAAYHLLGPTMGAMRTCATGPVQVFGVGLSAAGWAVLTDLDASLAADRCFDAAPLFGEELAALADALACCRTGAAMVAKAEEWLRRRISEEHDATLLFVGAVDSWLANASSPELIDLERRTGLSRRQVERKCNAVYGAPPKLLARKYRALRAAVAMAAGETVPIDGFYDQSHMIREVKHFTGLTPRRMRDHPGDLALRTITQRRALDGRVAPLLSHS